MIAPTLIYGPTAEQVARALISADAYLIRSDITSEDEFYTWKSGIKAPVYTDSRVLNSDPGAMAIVQRALGSSIRANFPSAECVVGVAEAGIVWSALAAVDLSLPHAFVRKAEKSYGRPGLLVGSPPRGARAVLVDDLVASGSSLEKSVHVLKSENDISTIGVQSIVNWDFIEMRDRFRALGIPVRALVSFPQLLDAGLERGLLSNEAKAELAAFYGNPRAHKWNISALWNEGRSDRTA